MKTHWLKNPNKNYLGHWDLPDNDLILTIKSAAWEDVVDPKTGETELKRIVHFVENYKPLICNQTNAISIYKSTGVRYLEDSKGSQIKLYIGSERDRKNKIDVECVRIRHEPVIKIDTSHFEEILNNCASLDELKVAFHELPRQIQAILNDLKNELKAKLQ